MYITRTQYDARRTQKVTHCPPRPARYCARRFAFQSLAPVATSSVWRVLGEALPFPQPLAALPALSTLPLCWPPFWPLLPHRPLRVAAECSGPRHCKKRLGTRISRAACGMQPAPGRDQNGLVQEQRPLHALDGSPIPGARTSMFARPVSACHHCFDFFFFSAVDHSGQRDVARPLPDRVCTWPQTYRSIGIVHSSSWPLRSSEHDLEAPCCQMLPRHDTLPSCILPNQSPKADAHADAHAASAYPTSPA